MIQIIKPSGSKYFNALIKKYEAEILAGQAVLDTYFNDTVGIGEHSDLMTEFDIQLEKIASAKDKLDALYASVANYEHKPVITSGN